MKILKIAFKNINSLRGEHEIDFTKEPFLQNSLFAITGPTGSGKTTILDVISLALFNQVPRLGKLSTTEVLKKGAILTRNQKEAYTKITYECKQGVFSSAWTISTARTGNLREYHMQIEDLSSHKLLDLKKSDIPGKNEDLIGLNYEQFIKSVVLAQGEFAKFLQVPKKERGALLEKITGTEIYRQLGQEAYLKYKEIGRGIEDKRLRMETFKEQLVEEEEFKEKVSQAESIQLVRKNLQLQLEKDTESIKLKEKLNQQREELRQSQNKLNRLEKDLKDFKEQKGEKLLKHEELQVFADDFHQWERLQENKAELNETLKTNREELKKLESNQKELQNRFATQFKLQLNPENSAEKLEFYKKKLRTLYKEKNEIGSTYRTTAKYIENLANPFNFNVKLANLESFTRELENKQAETTRNYQELEDKFQLGGADSIEKQNTLKKQLKEIRLAEKEEILLKQLNNELDQKTVDQKNLNQSLSTLPAKLQETKQKLQLLEAQLDAKEKTLEIEQLHKQLEDYRKDLVDKEPCPLCGAIHHPFAEDLPEKEEDLPGEVKKLQALVRQENKSLVQQETELKQLEKQDKILKKDLGTIEEKLKKKQELFQQNFTHALQQKGDLSYSEAESLLEQQLNELTKLEKLRDQRSDLQNLHQQTVQLSTLVSQGKQKRDEIRKYFTGSDFESEIGNAETSWNKNLQELDQNRTFSTKTSSSLEKVKSTLEDFTRTLLEQLREKGHNHIEEAIKQRLTSTIAQSWQKERESLNSEYLKLKTLKERLEKEIESQKKLENNESLEGLKTKIKSTREKLNESEKVYNSVSRIIENQKHHLKQIETLQGSIDKELKNAEHWELLNTLIGDATGNKFNDFAQDLTLSQLLQLANKRLSHLSDRYLIDQPLDEEDDSLVAIDEHMGGQRRSIKTLSGGETFILSLALALALSDLASRNIEINSLFIDEGFGTLDPETLDQTLDTLEVLQAESSKMIGVISHVESLKERIGTQIQLTRSGQGYSSLKIV